MIKHRVFIDNNNHFRYFCNQACDITDEKSIFGTWRKVTCKNCLKQKKLLKKTKSNKEKIK